MNNRELGEFGENVAVQYLENCGYTIVQRNYRCRAGEIDVIAGIHNRLSFIEVKTRRSSEYGRPCEAVADSKKKHIRAAACSYLRSLKNEGYAPVDVRFDVMEITIEHIEGAF